MGKPRIKRNPMAKPRNMDITNSDDDETLYCDVGSQNYIEDLPKIVNFTNPQ
jgi:hypothetical protein